MAIVVGDYSISGSLANVTVFPLGSDKACDGVVSDNTELSIQDLSGAMFTNSTALTTFLEERKITSINIRNERGPIPQWLIEKIPA